MSGSGRPSEEDMENLELLAKMEGLSPLEDDFVTNLFEESEWSEREAENFDRLCGRLGLL